jgi:protein TonB
MSHATSVVDAVSGRNAVHSPVLFQSLVLTEPESHQGRKSATFFISLVLHSALVLAVAVLPLLYYDALPSQEALKAFFVQPLEVAPPPPPPPPPAASSGVARPALKIEVQPPSGFIAPIDVPNEITPEEALDLGLEGGVAGGVEGGVPGGVVGGVVGGLPSGPPPPARVVRIGGQIAQPRKIRNVEPVFPDLAVQSRISALVILEAEVDVRGVVKNVKVLRGHPLFDDSAMQAVKQWRYQPLLLNGEPTGFILTVTVAFNLRAAS